MYIDYNTYAFAMLFAYFMFLGGILLATWNIERVAQHRFVEAAVDKVVRYNFRDVPRVNYKEDSSDEDEGEAEGEDEYEYISDSPEEVRYRNLRDRNPMSRILDTD